ncbi:hypothetical protein ANN_16291 [Periplaneta americana]|uniref:Uncharacterized protein n=1 Tax=Periplaneta americana TaxID=6978 RepID=A0ABQ8SJX9_PERAM|nr:hypothetical protein ANN_16291 [Periplaneta americana]
MAGLFEGGNEPLSSLKAVTLRTTVGVTLTGPLGGRVVIHNRRSARYDQDRGANALPTYVPGTLAPLPSERRETSLCHPSQSMSISRSVYREIQFFALIHHFPL